MGKGNKNQPQTGFQGFRGGKEKAVTFRTEPTFKLIKPFWINLLESKSYCFTDINVLSHIMALPIAYSLVYLALKEYFWKCKNTCACIKYYCSRRKLYVYTCFSLLLPVCKGKMSVYPQIKINYLICDHFRLNDKEAIIFITSQYLAKEVNTQKCSNLYTLGDNMFYETPTYSLRKS